MGESDARECEPTRELPPASSLPSPRMGTSTADAAFARTKATSDVLRLAGTMVTVFLTSGDRIHGEIARPFPQGFRCGTFTLWLFGVGEKITIDRRDVAFARTYRDGSVAGKRYDTVTYDVAHEDNRTFVASRKAVA